MNTSGNPHDPLQPLPADNQPTLLILRALKLGDLLVAVPALRALRRSYPEHRIIYAGPAWLQPIIELTGCVDELLETAGLDVALRLAPGMAPDGVRIAVNLHGRGPQSHRRLNELIPETRIGHAGAGWPGPPWHEDVHERVRWTGLLQWYGIPADPLDYRLHPPETKTPYADAAVVHPGAAFGSRLWPVERFAAVVQSLHKQGHRVIITGSMDERARALSVASAAGLPTESVLAGHQGLGEFAALVAQASLVISADTGAAHLATAYSRPSVTIFGPAPIRQWGPPPGPHIALTDESLRVGDVFGNSPDPALLAVTVAHVLAAIRTLGVG